MNFLIDILVGFLTAYLAFTNLLAAQILTWLGEETTEPAITETIKEPEAFSQIDSKRISYIPNILLTDPSYQRAAVLGSSDDLPAATTIDPLEALVNIYCTFITPTHIRTTTGTGFFVNPAGVILTNAHVAQFLLLEKTDALGDADCTIRSGNPATPHYQAELLYLPPSWIAEHAALIDATSPTGTGERDYALLYVTASIDQSSLPDQFPSLSVDTNLLPRSVKGGRVVAAGYPAESLLQNQANDDLIPKSADTRLTELYTFGSNYADVVSIEGSVIGEHGSSGGPIINDQGKVIGMITTRGDDELDGSGSLRAITLSHIHRTILEETGFSFARNISGDIANRADIFTETMAPFLTQLLAKEIGS